MSDIRLYMFQGTLKGRVLHEVQYEDISKLAWCEHQVSRVICQHEWTTQLAILVHYMSGHTCCVHALTGTQSYTTGPPSLPHDWNCTVQFVTWLDCSICHMIGSHSLSHDWTSHDWASQSVTWLHYSGCHMIGPVSHMTGLLNLSHDWTSQTVTWLLRLLHYWTTQNHMTEVLSLMITLFNLSYDWTIQYVTWLDYTTRTITWFNNAACHTLNNAAWFCLTNQRIITISFIMDACIVKWLGINTMYSTATCKVTMTLHRCFTCCI